MTQEEFLTHVNEVAKASTTETEFPELAPSRVRTFARFGIPGDEFKKNELVIYARTTGTATPVRKYDYGILGAPIISHSQVIGWYVRTPDNRVIKVSSNAIGKLNSPFVFKATEMQSVEGPVTYAPYAGQTAVTVVNPPAREALRRLRGEPSAAAAAVTP